MQLRLSPDRLNTNELYREDYIDGDKDYVEVSYIKRTVTKYNTGCTEMRISLETSQVTVSSLILTEETKKHLTVSDKAWNRFWGIREKTLAEKIYNHIYNFLFPSVKFIYNNPDKRNNKIIYNEKSTCILADKL